MLVVEILLRLSYLSGDTDQEDFFLIKIDTGMKNIKHVNDALLSL